MNLVVDASVAVKWFVREEFTEQAFRLVEGDDELFAPELLLIELGNVLWRKCLVTEFNLADAKLALSQVQIFLPDMVGGPEIIPAAMEIAVTLEHPIYDCVYLALAGQVDGKVITADKRFCNRLENTLFQDVAVYLPDFVGGA